MSIDIDSFISAVNLGKQFWECPHCKKNMQIDVKDIHYSKCWNSENLLLYVMMILCPNPECEEETIYMSTSQRHIEGTDVYFTPQYAEMLYPHGVYYHYPDFVPEPIRKDYEEAATISQLSPKASAALIRRALQGMIKAKWPDLKDKNLFNQINALDEKVPAHQKKALHGIRKIGNVGAHMKDPGAIADQDSPITVDDADNLIKLLEYLIKTWYVDEADAMALMKGISDRGDEVDKIQKGK